MRILIPAVFVLISLTACSRVVLPFEEMKAGFLLPGAIRESQWSAAHNAARLFLERETGALTMVRESIAENTTAVEVMDALIASGCNVIVAASYGYAGYVREVARRHPHIYFLQYQGADSGVRAGGNIRYYSDRAYEVSYLAGALAGLQMRGDASADGASAIGYVAPFPVPEILASVNAFTLGVRSILPEAFVLLSWSGSWSSPSAALAAARGLLRRGVAGLALQQDGIGAEMLEAHPDMPPGGWLIHLHTAAYETESPNLLASLEREWGRYYVREAQAISGGTWKAGVYSGGLREGMIRLRMHEERVPEQIKTYIDELAAGIRDESEKTMFAGPILDGNGETRVPADDFLPQTALPFLDWLVDGVRVTGEEQ